MNVLCYKATEKACKQVSIQIAEKTKFSRNVTHYTKKHKQTSLNKQFKFKKSFQPSEKKMQLLNFYIGVVHLSIEIIGKI